MKPNNRQQDIHWKHQIDFQIHPTKPRYWSNNKPEMKMRIQCKKCDVYIRWPCKDEIIHWHKLSNKNITLEDFTNDFLRNGNKSIYWEPKPIDGNQVIWLDVSYKDFQKVIDLGASYFKPKNQFYFYTNNKNIESLIYWVQEPELSKLYKYFSEEPVGNYKAYTG